MIIIKNIGIKKILLNLLFLFGGFFLTYLLTWKLHIILRISWLIVFTIIYYLFLKYRKKIKIIINKILKKIKD